jgi:hypothetical protein
MFPSKNGKSYGSAYVAKKKDAMHGEGNKAVSEPSKPTAPQAPTKTAPTGEANKMSSYPDPAADNTANTKASPEGVDAGAVAAQHGPASSVTLHHGIDNHVVVSRHPKTGHMHMSQHKSHADAHEAAKQLAGEQHTENENTAPNAEQTSGGDMFGNDGFKTPHLA